VIDGARQWPDRRLRGRLPYRRRPLSCQVVPDSIGRGIVGAIGSGADEFL
jgi:hypothetical protein